MRRSPLLFAVLAAVLVAAACSSAPDDSAVAADIKAKFYSDPVLKTANLTVESKQGVVTLAGDAPSEAARYQAFKLALESKGVVKVEDQMSVAVAQVAGPPVIPEPEPAPAPAPRRRMTPRPAPPEPKPAPAPQPAPAPVAAAPAPAPQPVEPQEPEELEVTIPAGTSVIIRMVDSVDSEVHRTGQVFLASLDAPITVDGETVIPRGADVRVRLAEAKSAGRMTGRSELRMELTRLEYQGKSYALVSSTYEQVGSSRGKNTAAKIGGGAAIGAAIGAIAGGGKGAAIGAVIGGGAGTAAQVFTKGQQIRIPSETRLDFRLEAPVDVVYMPEEERSYRR